MPTPRELAIEHLSEAKRYVKTNVPEATRLIHEAIAAMRDVSHPRVDQLISNLFVAWKYIQVEPDVAIGYCAAAQFELQCIKGVECTN